MPLRLPCGIPEKERIAANPEPPAAVAPTLSGDAGDGSAERQERPVLPRPRTEGAASTFNLAKILCRAQLV